MSSNPDALLGPAEVRELAAALGVRPTKQRGQNFVIDANTVRRIVRTADVRPDDVVVEVGPGLGSLTLALLEVADRVTAVEIDDTLASALPATVTARMPERAERFALVHSDAMQVTELPGPPPTALVANLPYNVAVPVLLHMLEHFPTIERTLVMVQAEVADRLAAPPGSKVYGVPSVKANWYAEVKRAGSIGRTVFWPAPNVDSGLVALTRRPEPPKTTATRREVFAVVDAAFAQRRKTLRAALAGWAGSAAAAEVAIVAAGVSPQARGESLTVEEFARIAENKPTGTEVTTHAGTEREAGAAENASGVGAGDAPSASRAAETASTVRPGDAQREARAAEVVGDAQGGSALREAGPAESASPGRAGNAPHEGRPAEAPSDAHADNAHAQHNKEPRK